MQHLLHKAESIPPIVNLGAGSTVVLTSLFLKIATIFQGIGFILGTLFIAFQFYVSVRKYLREHKK